ncbi:MAG: hypothetical protein IPJ37_07915 [Bacteroidales bacterium]|nr:hypothetical protein [Bacteroidales bacterium]
MKDCNEKSIIAKLRGIDPFENYELTDEDSQISTIVGGKDLIEGYSLTLKEKPGSVLILYKKSITDK